MSTAGRYIPNYTTEDYFQWEGDWELFDGLAVATVPSPFADHQHVGLRISAAFLQQLQKSACDGCQVFYELDWIVDEHTVVRPDISIACGDKVEKHLEYPPSLIVEVLSPATAEKDRTLKWTLYQQQGVKYYLLADPEQKSLIVFKLDAGKYIQQRPSGHFRLELVDGCQVELDAQAVFE